MSETIITPPKKKLFPLIVKAIFRGALKSVPFGAVVTETIDTVTENALPSKSLLSDASLTENEVHALNKVKHWVQIITQILVVGTIVYLVVTGKIDVKILEDFEDNLIR